MKYKLLQTLSSDTFYLFKIITRYTLGSHSLSLSLFSCLLSGTSRRSGVREMECSLRQTYSQSVRQSLPVTTAQRKKFLLVFLTGHTTEDRHRQTIDRQFHNFCLRNFKAYLRLGRRVCQLFHIWYIISQKVCE